MTTETAIGICGECKYSRQIPSCHGAVFWLCERSAFDPRFPKYPPLPVIRCSGFEARRAGDDETDLQRHS